MFQGQSFLDASQSRSGSNASSMSYSSAHHHHARPEDSDLPLVMEEIMAAMGGVAAGLTLHHSAGEGVLLSGVGRASLPAAHATILEPAATFAAELRDGAAVWRAGVARVGDTTMLIPVQNVAGHGQLVISVFFDRDDGAAMTRAEEVYRERRPFAIGYFRLWQLDRIRRQRCDALETALNLGEIGVLLINRRGGISFANDAAERVLFAGDGLRNDKGELRANTLAESVSLQVALNHVIASQSELDAGGTTEPAPILALQRKSGPPLTISLLAPDSPPVEPGDVAAIMFVVDPQLDTAQMIEPVCRLYHLSPVETSLVCHLVQGRALAHASQLMRVKEQTARSYMKHIFLKTATNRQTELIVLMLSSAVRMRKGLTRRALNLSASIIARS